MQKIQKLNENKNFLVDERYDLERKILNQQKCLNLQKLENKQKKIQKQSL